MSTESLLREAELNWVAWHVGANQDMCQSPIEELMLWGFLAQTGEDRLMPREYVRAWEHASGLRVFAGPEVVGAWDLGPCKGVGRVLGVVLQQMPVGAFKLDFAAILWSTDSIVDGLRCYVRAIAIECDGHEFHEKTKEQAARDKSRDRELVLAGWRVMRFTGSEIYRDAAACVRQAQDCTRRIAKERGLLTQPVESATAGGGAP